MVAAVLKICHRREGAHSLSTIEKEGQSNMGVGEHTRQRLPKQKSKQNMSNKTRLARECHLS